MKSLSNFWVIAFLLLPCLCLAQTATSVQTSAIPWPTSYAVVSRDANSCLWEGTNYIQGPNGQVVAKAHHYTELATGLNFQDSTGQWTPSKEEIDILPDGSAAATNGQHQAYFPADIHNGVIKLITPDGLQLQSQPVGLSYDDGTNTVLIAETTNSVGQLISSNQILYTKAFVGIDADLLYTYTKAGFEQDVILREQPPTPESFGLNPDTTRLQVLTEFFNPPQPGVSAATVPTAAGNLENDYLTFGTMTMASGRAFMLGTTTPSVSVNKEWLSLQGRQVLAEEVPLASIASQLNALPSAQTASARRNFPLDVVSAKQLLPAQRLAHAPGKHPIQMVRIKPPSRGFVLDYQAVDGSLTNYTFQGDTTYYISSYLALYGTNNTFEGGAVIKYASDSLLVVEGNVPGTSVQTLTSAYRPVVFTAVDDNSVGESIGTGNPTNYYALYALQIDGIEGSPGTLNNIRIAYAQTAIGISQLSAKFLNIQVVNCGTACEVGYGEATFENGLFANDQEDFNFDFSLGYATNVTISGSSSLGGGSSSSLDMVNCILANVTNTAFGEGDHNGFYESTEFGTNFKTNLFYPFQTVGGGNYYLATNCAFIGAGTSNINSALLADLATKTTWPPFVYSSITLATNLTLSPYVSRDNSGTPDLGYHYDPLDYALGLVYTTNATITVTPGTAIGLFSESPGLYSVGLTTGAQLICQGYANDVIQMVAFNTVQECGTNWLEPAYAMVTDAFSGGPATGINSAFTHWSLMAQDMPHWVLFSDDVDNFQNCEFYSGQLQDDGQSLVNFTNCLFQRVNGLIASTGAPTIQNNLFWNGTFDLASATNALVDDNLFDHTIISRPLRGRPAQTSNAGYNAYVTNCNTLSPVNPSDIILSNSPAYETNWFGKFYLPTNSPLFQKGSTNANSLGLYEYTVATNEIPEGTNEVSISYHYVATDTNGNPLDTYVAGIPNYIVDSSGTGMDTNSLPYWWEGEYFGQVGLDPNSDPDGDGNSLLSDYQNGIDPNVISFSLQFTNNYWNTIASGNVSIEDGEPFYEAIVVDDTNYMADAIWQTYTGANIMVNLGTTQGWHSVWVGLRGRATNEMQTWVPTRLKFQSTPPMLVVTNPVVGLTTQPIIQLQGYSTESLASLSYDLTNANGLFTNQQALILDQYFNTNAFEYTTNYFQCFDVPLFNGLNILTLHATDLAGNVTATNFAFTLDYSSATNPPVIQLNWPQNGTQISGTNFTCRGYLSEPTAQVVAQIVNTNGITNSASGQVGRGGDFWIQGLPLSGGTNYLSLTATDAAGNVSATNIVVSQSALVLTITSANFGQPVQGTISDWTNYTVWANGVIATNNGNGTWIAYPNITLDTPVVQVRAIPNSDNGGYGGGQ